MVMRHSSVERALPPDIEDQCRSLGIAVRHIQGCHRDEIILFPIDRGKIRIGFITNMSNKSWEQVSVYASLKRQGPCRFGVQLHWDGWMIVIVLLMLPLACYAMILRGILLPVSPATHLLATAVIVVFATMFLVAVPIALLYGWYISCRKGYRKLLNAVDSLFLNYDEIS